MYFSFSIIFSLPSEWFMRPTKVAKLLGETKFIKKIIEQLNYIEIIYTKINDNMNIRMYKSFHSLSWKVKVYKNLTFSNSTKNRPKEVLSLSVNHYKLQHLQKLLLGHAYFSLHIMTSLIYSQLQCDYVMKSSLIPYQ